ncbi:MULTISPECIES: hypothetical protein [unclassified Streptomyces]|uniref:hypothetical protein n=1 Tax=unclassified Streptomyces TaxID=2593676 RepID=UPI0033E1C3E5
MGTKDQFEDKANDLADKAKGAMGSERDEASERASQAQDEASEGAREEEGEFNRDYDA